MPQGAWPLPHPADRHGHGGDYLRNRLPPAGGAQMREHCENTPVAVLVLGDVELHEDVADMRLDSALAHDQPRRDGAVCEALGHQLENIPLTFGQTSQGPAVAWREETGEVNPPGWLTVVVLPMPPQHGLLDPIRDAPDRVLSSAEMGPGAKT